MCPSVSILGNFRQAVNQQIFRQGVWGRGYESGLLAVHASRLLHALLPSAELRLLPAPSGSLAAVTPIPPMRTRAGPLPRLTGPGAVCHDKASNKGGDSKHDLSERTRAVSRPRGELQ